MIEYLIFLMAFSIVPVTPTCIILIECLRKYKIKYNLNKILYYITYVLIYIINCWFWGTLIYIGAVPS